MAHYNPIQVAFTPSQSVIEGSGALGAGLRDAWLMHAKDRDTTRALDQEDSKLDFQIADANVKNENAMLKHFLDIQKYNLDFDKNAAETAANNLSGRLFSNTSPDLVTAIGVDINDKNTVNALGKAFPTTPKSILEDQKNVYANEQTQIDDATQGAWWVAKNPELSKQLGIENTPDGWRKASSLYKAEANSKDGYGSPAQIQKEYEYYKSQGGTMPFEKFWLAKNKPYGTNFNLGEQLVQNKDNLVDTLGLDINYLENGDLSKITPQQKAILDREVETYKVQNPKYITPDAQKRMEAFAAIVGNADDLGKYYFSASNGDAGASGILDNAFNKVVKYFGNISDDDLKDLQASDNYSSIRNTFLKVNSGAAVTPEEFSRFSDAFGTLWQSDKAAAQGVITALKNTQAEINAIKAGVTNKVIFNHDYGYMVNNLGTAINSIENYALGNNKKVVKSEEVSFKKPTKATQAPTQANNVITQVPELLNVSVQPDGSIIGYFSDGTQKIRGK
jgi:hypothetical protein